MALSFAVLTQGQSATNGTSFATASVSPTADKPVFLCVTSQAVASGDRQVPTSVTGASMTWVLVASVIDTTFVANSIWRAQSASPGSGALTLNYGLTQDNAQWSVIEVTGAYGASSANGAEAVGAISKAQAQNTTSTTAAIVCRDTQNGLLASHGWSSIVSGTAATATPASGWTEQTEQSTAESGYSSSHEAQTRTSNDTTATATWSTTSGSGGTVSVIALDIVGAKPLITVQPVQQTSTVASTATFGVTATTSGGTLTYQWQDRISGTWTDIGSATSSGYTTGTLSSSDNGRLFRVKVTDSNGTTISAEVYLFLTGLASAGKGREHTAWISGSTRKAGSRSGLKFLKLRSVARHTPNKNNKDFIVAWNTWYFPVAAASGSTGTLARTNANDTSSAAGATIIVSSLNRTNANDTSAASSTTTILATLTRTNTNDTSTASGSPISVGSLARTNTNDTSSASGTTVVIGSSTTTNNNDTLAASGSAGTVPEGTLFYTNINDTVVSIGTTTLLGSLSITNNNDILAASGSSGTPGMGITTRLPLTGAGAT